MNPTLNTAPRVAWLMALLGLVPVIASAQSTPIPPATEAEEDLIILSPFVVSSASEEGYYAPEAVGATRTRTELINLPISVTVFNENFIADIGARDLVDIVSFASGVSGAPTAASDTAGGDTLGFNIRGQGGFVPNRNGVRRLRLVDPATIQRVEVIKGPNSLLYGPASPGGGVNYVTKRPEQRKIASSTLQVGSYDFYKASVDVNVPTASKNLAVRFVGSYEDSQSWIDRFHKYQSVLYPSMTWWIRPETTLTLEWEQTIQDRDTPQGTLPWHYWVDPDAMARLVGRDWNTRGRHDYHATEMTALTVELRHKFNDNFNLRLNWSDVSWEEFTKNSAAGMGVASLFTAPTLNRTSIAPSSGGTAAPKDPMTLGGRTHSYTDRGSWDKYRQAELYNTFEVAGVKVQNLFGYQLAQEKFVNVLATTGAAADTTLWNLQDASSWILSERFAPDHPVNYGQGTGAYARNTTNSGYLINQMAFFGDKLHTMIGARVDKIRGDNLSNPTVNNTTAWVPGGDTVPPQSSTLAYSYPEWPTKISPQFGVNYTVVKGMALYANYSKSIVNLYTSVARRRDGSSFVPVPGTGEGYDFGVKTDMFAGKVSGVLAFFQLDEKDIVRQLAQVSLPDVDNGALFTPSEQSGVNRSQGVELDVTVRPTKRLQIGGSYAYNYSWVLSDTSAVAYLNGGMANGTAVETRTNHQLASTTRHRYSAFLRQELGAIGPFTSTYVTANGTIVGDRPYTETWYKKVTSATDGGVMTEPGRMDAYALFNVGVGGEFTFRKTKFNLSLMVKNVFNEQYLANRYYWGNPREFLFTSRVNF